MFFRRLSSRVPDLLGRPFLPTASILLALLLAVPALGIGPMGDDYMLMARVDPGLRVPGFAYAPLDLFTFASGDPAQRTLLREEGVFGWWMAEDFRMAFWRPLSSLTHVIDHLLWPRSSALAHVHSLAWFAVLLVILARLYRRFHAPWVAHLALLLYAVDDARAWVLGWNANRNALVAAVVAFAALLLHDRWRRDAWRPGRILAPALFAAALLGGEASLAVTGYLLAHALFVDPEGSLRQRLARLLPYAALSVAWLAAYKELGFGTAGGGMYLNPLDEPGAYVRAAAERLPVLLAAQLGLSVADVWLVLSAPARLAAWTLALAWLAAVGAALLPLWRRSPACRFWTLGALLSLPPVCATFPMDRLLVFAGVGAMGVVASFLGDWLEGRTPTPPRRRGLVTAGVVLAFAVCHVLVAPLLLPVRVWAVGFISRMAASLSTSIPADESVRSRTLVILSSAAEFTTFPVWMERQAGGIPRPRRMRLLATCFGPLEVSRPDAATLRVRPARGFMDYDSLRIVRGRSRPFRPGDEVVLSDLRVRVREVTADGRPAEADFTFAVPLDDPSLMWTRLRAGGALVPWSPPAVGARRSLPSIAPRQEGSGAPQR